MSRARNIIECAFGRLNQKWRIFQITIQQLPETTELIIKAACILHNVILDLETVPDASQQNHAECLREREKDDCDNDFCTGNGQEVRNELAESFLQNPI